MLQKCTPRQSILLLTLASTTAFAAPADAVSTAPSDFKPYVHRLIVHDKTGEFADGVLAETDHPHTGGRAQLRLSVPGQRQSMARLGAYTSPIVTSEVRFNEVILSWNVDHSPGAGFVVAARMGAGADDWSPFLRFGAGGAHPPEMETRTACSAGKVVVDIFRSRQRFDRIQYRLWAQGTDAQRPDVVGIDRFFIVLSDTTDQRNPADVAHMPAPTAPDAWQRRLSVPFRSQRSAPEAIAGQVCSPTSLSMVLAYRGCARPIAEVAERVFDEHDELFGNWPNAAQTAYDYGFPAHITRVTGWPQVERLIADGQPVIVSVTVRENELTGAPYRRTKGHLLVITGFDDAGNVLVNDPAGRTEEAGMTTYRRSDLEKVWLQTKAGTAYIIEPRPGVDPGDNQTFGEPLVDVASVVPGIVLDVRYATANNFTGQVLYPKARCLVRRSVAQRLARVQQRLKKQGYGLKIFDGYRPISAQAKMWALMPDPRYVANPAGGSRHNRGAAVDVALVDAEGQPVEMPTDFDDFTAAAHRDYGGGSEASRRHRDILIEAMQAEGFTGLSTEWWHFDAPNWQSYPLVDVDLSNYAAPQ